MKIVFLCHFSSSIIRDELELKDYRVRNTIQGWFGRGPVVYDDFAIWVSDYISEFEKYDSLDVHIIAPHKGMKRATQSFDRNHTHYHFVKCDGGFLRDVVNRKFKLEQKTDYAATRKRIGGVIDDVNPDIVLLCGAENPYYSLSVLDVKDKPVYVILQTLLNDPKRIGMGIGTAYRRRVEANIFRHARFFCTSEEKAMNTIRCFNNDALFLPAGFPTHRPDVPLSKSKECDFVFFSRVVSKNKGIEDVIEALAMVKKEFPKVSLHIIGGSNTDYKSFLLDQIKRLDVQDNIRFLGYFQNMEDTYTHVAKAKVVVVPGITAALNSTVRESMLMGKPTICYDTSGTKDINKERRCLLTAPLCDKKMLAGQMMFALKNEDQTQQIARNGKEYAEKVFSNVAIVKRLIENCKLIIENYNHHVPIKGSF